MTAVSQAGRVLARQMRKRSTQLVESFVEQIQEAALPGYRVFARPVLEQGATQLYGAWLESLTTGDARPLRVCASELGSRRRQQGVQPGELARVAEVFCTVTRDAARTAGEKDAQNAVESLLDVFVNAFTVGQDRPHLDTAPAPRAGGKRMTDHPENEIEPQSALERLQAQAHQLETIAQVSRQLTAALDLDDLLLQVVEVIRSSFDYYHVHVYLLDRESDALIMRDGTGEIGETLKARGHRIELGRGMVGMVGQTGESLLAADVSRQPSWLPNAMLPETRSELTVPLKVGGRVLGALDVQSNEVGGLSDTDLMLMESLAQQIAVAVQNAILFRETRAVSIVSRAVSSELGMENVFSAASRELKAVVDFDYMAIAKYYEIAQQVELIGVDDQTNVDIPLEEGVQLPVALCIPGLAIQQGRSIIVPDLEAEPYRTFIDAEIWIKHGMRSVLSVPLQTRGQIVATINLISARDRAFTADDAHLMEQIGGQLATALENAAIFENIQQMVRQRASESAVFQAMVENVSEAIALANVEQIVTYANPAFYALHGYDPETDDLTRRSLTSFIVAEDEGALSDKVRDHLLAGSLWHDEVEQRRRDGKVFQASTTIFAIRDRRGEPVAVAALIRDVTAERKMMTISRVASSTPDLGRLAPSLLETIAADTDIDRAVLILYDEIGPEGPETMSVIAVYDPETGGRHIVDRCLEAENSPFSTVVYHEEQAIWVSDVATDERLFEEGRKLLLENSIAAMLALPILVGDSVVGMVAFDWRKHVELSYEQIALYQVMVNQISTAVENARRVARQQEALQEALDRRAREVATSIEVGQAISAAPELGELFDRVVTLIKERFGYYHAQVYQIDPQQNELDLAAGYGEPGRIMRERGHRIPLGKGLTGTAAVTGEPVRVDDVSRQENWLPNPLLPDTRSELAVPIKLGERVLGVLDVQSDELAGCTEDDELLMLGLCGQIAVSIHNAQILADMQRLVHERTDKLGVLQDLADQNAALLAKVNRSHQAAYRRAQQLELSAGVSEQLTSNLDLDKVLAAVVNLIQQGFGYYHVHVYLVEKATGDLVMKKGTMKERAHRIPVGKGLIGRAAATGQTVLVPDVHQVEDWLRDPLLPDAESELSVPLKIGKEVIGVLDVQSNETGGLTEEDQALLEGLAGQIAVAVQNAQVFAAAERQVETRTREMRVFQALAENAADAIAMADLEGNLCYANAAWYELYGYDLDSQEALGISVDDIWPGDACEWMSSAVGQASSREWRGEVRHTRPNDTPVAIELTLFVVRDEQAGPSAVAALGRDVTASRLSGELTLLVSSASLLSELGVDLLGAILRGLNVDSGSFFIYEDADDLVPRWVRTVATYDEDACSVIVVDQTEPFDGESIHGELVRVGEPIVHDELGLLAAHHRAAGQEPAVKAIAALPLVSETGRVCGALLLQRKRDSRFKEEAKFLEPVLQQVSLAVSNLMLREAQQRETSEMLDRRTIEMRTTTQVAQAIASATDLDELFRRVVTLVKEQFGHYHVHMYLVDANNQDLELVAGYGDPGRIMKERGHRIPMGKGLVGTAAQSGEPVLASDVSQAENWLPNPLLPDTQSEVAVPIQLGDQVLGVLDVQDDQVAGLSQDTRVLLQGLCGQIAIAIANTRLLEEMQISLRQTALLLGLSTALSSLTEPQLIANALAKQLMGIANIERCSVILCSDRDDKGVPQTAQVYAVSDRDPRQRGWTIGQMYTLSEYPTLLNVVIRRREIWAASDVAGEGSLVDAEQALLQEGGSVSAVVVPMSSGERVLGYFILQDRQPYTFSAAELELYRGIANQSATAFSNALSLQVVQDRLDEMNMLYESSRAVSTASTREAVAETIIQRIVSTNADRCEILLYERGAHSLEVVGSWAAAGDAPKPGTRYRVSEYPLNEVVPRLGQEGLCVASVGDMDQHDQVRQMCAARGIKALALVPLAVGEEYLGFLSIERHRGGAFGADVLRFYETIASQSAVALRNMQLIEQTTRQLDQLQASYDDVARLANTVRELSSPVIQIWDDVLVLPLVGAIDSRRAMNMMEALLTGITAYQAEQVIIDVTGVPVMDTSIANHLLQTIKAASLLGAECMLVGISSEMAQTIVGLGLDLRSITTYSNLRAGIRAALQRAGFIIAPLLSDDGEIGS